MRVVRLYHSAVVGEYRERDRLLRDRHAHEMHLISAPAFEEGGQIVRFSPRAHDVDVHVVATRGRQVPNLFRFQQLELEAIIRRVRPEIVDIHEEPYSLAAAGVLWALARVAPRTPICVYTAQNLVGRRYPPPFSLIERTVLRRAAAAYPCSGEGGERLRRRGFTGAINVLPLGVSIPPERACAPTTSTAFPPVKVGFVGRLEPYKGPMIALDAFAAAAATTEAEATLTIIGEGSEMTSLQARAAELGVAGRVDFTGFLDQDTTLERIAELDIVLVPSLTTPVWKEQYGRVPTQAMAASVAVIASDSGSLREVVADAGVLVPEGDTVAFTRELTALLVDPARRRELGARGRERAIDHFSWEALSDGVDRMYREMAREGARR